VIASALGLVLVLLLAGVIAARCGFTNDAGIDALNGYVVYVCIPALVLSLVPKLEMRRELLVLIAVPWVLLVVAVVAVLVASRILRLARETTGALLLCLPLGNTSFLGYPMVGALLGEPAVRLAVIYDQLGSFLILATWGVLVASSYGAGRGFTWRGALRRILLFPPLLALVAALLPWHLPPWAEPILKRIGDSLVPVAMFAVGLKLKLRMTRRDMGAAAIGLAFKMGVMPLLAIKLARGLGAPPDVVAVATLESAMPPMITAGALAMGAELRPHLVATLVGYGILLAMVTLPLWSLVVR
jgi:predicted permease